ncbi:MAG: cyclic nucleotide-binding domain-containing protein [Myxococcales bacterium]|nr:cyclic nucleotide-binding domain-containing protein [Myxococcales bacterium]
MDPRELKDKATELFSKGKFAKSAETYEQYCKADPKDLQARLRMGDAWSKSGKKDRAIIAYQAAAEGFAKDGFLPRAIAASKLVLELDPAHKGIAQMLADLYARKSGASRPSTARTIGAKPDPVAAPKAAPSPMNRPDAIEISVEEDAPAPPPPPAPAEPSPTNRADAIEIAIEEDRPEHSKPPPEALDSGDGIEIELGTQPVSGEIEVPIVGVDLTPAPGALPAETSYELEVSEPAAPAPSPFELDPPPAPESHYELRDVVEAPPPQPERVPRPVAVAAPPPSREPVELPVTPEPHFELSDVVESPPPPPEDAVALDPPAPPPRPPEEVRAPVAPPPPPPEPARAPVAVTAPPPPPPEEVRAPVAPPPPPPEPARAPVAVTAPPPPEDVRSPVAPAPPPEPVRAPIAAAAPPPPPPPEDDVVILTKKRVEPPVTSSPSGATTAPPGLKPKRQDPVEPPRSTPNGARIWLPPTFQPPAAAPLNAAAPTSAPAPRVEAVSAQTELERSLEVFTQFDVDVRPAAPSPVVAEPQRVPIVASFTELELEGDSLLQAVEAAATHGLGVPKSSPSMSLAAEEIMEAPDDLKPDPGALPKIPLFSDLPEDAFIALFERCPLRRAEPGDRIFEQGSQGTSFFVICAGKVRVLRTDGDATRELATLEEGAFFGEMALLSDAPRSASVEAAAEDTQLLEIPASVLTDLSSQHPTVATALKKFCRQRLLANLMNSASLFKPFTKSERRGLVQRFRARDAVAGEVLIQEGRPSDGLYVVLTGEVAVVMGNRQVATLREGQVFGEMSLLTRSPTSATVKTTRRTSFLRLPREDFDELIMSHPQILEQVAELTDERRKQNASLQVRPDATAEMV